MVQRIPALVPDAVASTLSEEYLSVHKRSLFNMPYKELQVKNIGSILYIYIYYIYMYIYRDRQPLHATSKERKREYTVRALASKKKVRRACRKR